MTLNLDGIRQAIARLYDAQVSIVRHDTETVDADGELTIEGTEIYCGPGMIGDRQTPTESQSGHMVHTDATAMLRIPVDAPLLEPDDTVCIVGLGQLWSVVDEVVSSHMVTRRYSLRRTDWRTT